jgi:PAS domain S-box-containing protein
MSGQTHTIWDVEFLNQILDSMAEGVFTLDVQGRITSWNKSMERISGYGSDEALGRSCEILGFSRCFGRVCPADIQKCGILEHGNPEAKECLLRHKQGYNVPVIKQARVVQDEMDQVRGIVETVTDMTELEKARRKAEEASLRLGEVYRLDNIIGKSSLMQNVFSAVKAAANSRSTILIQGESGTGKELIASAIHYNSEQAKEPLVTVNCSALSESLLESELFGHVKGAFTGALQDRRGRFEEADKGSIFLDEIGELSPFMQVKLLRVLQEREIERVGESKRRKVDIRVIAATHQDLPALAREGSFREDLFYRLKVFPIYLPALRERKEDIPLLVSHFISKFAEKSGKKIKGLEPEAMRALLDYPWPGNVRELENALEHAFILCRQDNIALTELPLEIREYRSGSEVIKNIGSQMKEEDKKSLSRERLLELLYEYGWNKAEVARQVGISRTAIWKYMKKWDIPLQGFANNKSA